MKNNRYIEEKESNSRAIFNSKREREGGAKGKKQKESTVESQLFQLIHDDRTIHIITTFHKSMIF